MAVFEEGIAICVNGICYLKGSNGFPKDKSKGIFYLRKAAENNNSKATYSLAKIFIESGNYLEAVKYLEIGTKLNNEEALVTYGEMLCTADHVPLNLSRGIQLLQRALKTVNDVKLLTIIGYRFYKIHSPPQLLVDARRCFMKGESLNHPSSIFNYGFMLEKGEGGEKNIKKAIELFIRAAELNVIPALIHLGEICEEGRYMDEPLSNKAIEYYEKAKNLGREEAERAIERVKLRRSNRAANLRVIDGSDLLIGLMLRDFLDL